MLYAYKEEAIALSAVCGRSGRDARHTRRPALVLQYEGMSVVVFVQQTVRTTVTHRRPDFLIVAAFNGRRVTVVLETGAEEWHSDKSRERARTEELGVAVLHARPDHVMRTRFAPAVLNWVRARLG